MHFLRLLPAFLLTGLLLTSCGNTTSDSDTPQPDLYGSFNRRGMLHHLATNIITPAFADFATQADSLVLLTTAFEQAPTANALAAVQQQWRRAAGAYKRAEVYQFGPVKSLLLAPNIDFWPTRPDNVERIISSGAVFSDALIEQQGASVKGLAALEYLLFSRAGGPATELARLHTAPAAGPRRAYLLALTQNLRTQARRARDAWQNDYAATYAANDGPGLNGSINLTVNQLIAHLDYVRMTKVGVPAGKKDGTVRPNEVEAYESANSLAHLLNNLTGLERLYSGTTAAGINGPGFDDFLLHLNAQTSGQPLAARITAQLADCRAKAHVLSPSLSAAITTNPAGVDALYDSLKQLLILVKVDMASSLSVTLTLNDNDGD